MLGTIVNTMTVVAGSLIGLLFRGGIPEKYDQTMMHAIGLAVVLIGVKTALQHSSGDIHPVDLSSDEAFLWCVMRAYLCRAHTKG